MYEVRITFSTPVCDSKECGIVMADSEWDAITKTAEFFKKNENNITINNITASKVDHNKLTGHYFLGFIIVE